MFIFELFVDFLRQGLGWEWSSLLCNSQFSGYFAQVCTQHLKLWDTTGVQQITWAHKTWSKSNAEAQDQCQTSPFTAKVEINFKFKLLYTLYFQINFKFKFKLLYLPSGGDRPSDRRRDTADWRKPPENKFCTGCRKLFYTGSENNVCTCCENKVCTGSQNKACTRYENKAYRWEHFLHQMKNLFFW